MDYIVAFDVNHVNRTCSAFARSKSTMQDNEFEVLPLNTFVMHKGRKHCVMLMGLDKDSAHFEKQKFFQTMKYNGYTKV